MKQRYLDALMAATLLAVAHPPVASAHDLTEDLRACAAESDDVRRLACYDREMARLATPPSAAQPATPVPVTTPVPSTEESFGLNEEQARKKQNVEDAPKLKRLNATLTRISRRPQGEFVLTLDNGQVWVQKQPATFEAKIGDTVTIKAAALGSFIMTTASGRSTRVTRVL